MKPIYFPFTYVPRWVAEIFAACFRQFIVYQPSGNKLPDGMHSWVEKKIMDIRVPVRTADDRLVEVSKYFRAFATLHGESKDLKAATKLGQQNGIPFFGESAASRIIAEMKKDGRPESTGANFDPLFDAQVFLDFAQEFDQQIHELNQWITENDRRSLNLLNMIDGENSNALALNPLTAEIKTDNPGEYMAPGRLQAWSYLFVKDPADSGLFITSSQTVFDHLIENLNSAEKIMELDELPAGDDGDCAWQNQFVKKMGELVDNRWPPAEQIQIDMPRPEDQRSDLTLLLYLVPGQSPTNLFYGLIPDHDGVTIKPLNRAGFSNTLLGLILRRPGKPYST